MSNIRLNSSSCRYSSRHSGLSASSASVLPSRALVISSKPNLPGLGGGGVKDKDEDEDEDEGEDEGEGEDDDDDDADESESDDDDDDWHPAM